MGILKNFFGVGGPDADKVGAAAEKVGGALDKLFTSKEEKLTHAEVMERLKQTPAALQVQANMVEGQHRTVFVAGWRPFTGWVCGSALAYHFIARDLLAWCLTNLPWDITAPPALEMAPLLTILGGMLGLAGLRTSEKKSGAAV